MLLGTESLSINYCYCFKSYLARLLVPYIYQLIFTNNLGWVCQFPHSVYEDKVAERLNYLTKVTQLVCGRARVQSQVGWLQNPS